MKMLRWRFLPVVLLVLMITAVSATVLADWDSMIISGFGEEIKITVAEVKELPVIEKTVVSVNSAGNKKEYTITGALLADLLKKHGKLQHNLKSIRLIAGDGYEIDVDQSILQQRDIIIGYLIDGKPLKERYQPFRVVIPEERAMYWLKNLVKIEVLDLVETVEIDKVYFLETAISEVEQLDYTYYDSVDQAVKVAELVEKLGISTDLRTVRLLASDGLDKDEERDIFAGGYLKISGDYAPMFLSPDLPKGMFVKDLLLINYGQNALCSLNNMLKTLNQVTVADNTGVNIADLLAQTGLTAAEQYRFKAIDGYAVEVAATELDNGIIYFDHKGRVRSFFANLPKNYSVKNLYLIEGIK